MGAYDNWVNQEKWPWTRGAAMILIVSVALWLLFIEIVI